MLTASAWAKNYLEGLKTVLDRLPPGALDSMAKLLEQARAERRQIFVIGNGGSAATASHLMNDLGKGTLGHKGDLPGPRFRILALTDNVSLMTAWANDTDYNRVFSEPLKNLAQPGDLLIAISASGNSPNILAAVQVARKIGLQVIAWTGFDGGKLSQLADVAFVAPAHDYGMVEDAHMILDHILTGYFYEKAKSKQRG